MAADGASGGREADRSTHSCVIRTFLPLGESSEYTKRLSPIDSAGSASGAI